jgi:hypothetical protein
LTNFIVSRTNGRLDITGQNLDARVYMSNRFQVANCAARIKNGSEQPLTEVQFFAELSFPYFKEHGTGRSRVTVSDAEASQAVRSVLARIAGDPVQYAKLMAQSIIPEPWFWTLCTSTEFAFAHNPASTKVVSAETAAEDNSYRYI